MRHDDGRLSDYRNVSNVRCHLLYCCRYGDWTGDSLWRQSGSPLRTDGTYRFQIYYTEGIRYYRRRISKYILDFFTAIIFACLLGYVVSAIAIPQFIIFMILFVLAGFIYPLTTPEMICDLMDH